MSGEYRVTVQETVVVGGRRLAQEVDRYYYVRAHNAKQAAKLVRGVVTEVVKIS